MTAAHGARERLELLGDALRRHGGVRVERTGIGVHEMTVAGRVKVACHPQPWDGPLYFCVPHHDGGPCRVLGGAEQLTEVAGVVLRMVRPEAGSRESGAAPEQEGAG